MRVSGGGRNLNSSWYLSWLPPPASSWKSLPCSQGRHKSLPNHHIKSPHVRNLSPDLCHYHFHYGTWFAKKRGREKWAQDKVNTLQLHLTYEKSGLFSVPWLCVNSRTGWNQVEGSVLIFSLASNDASFLNASSSFSCSSVVCARKYREKPLHIKEIERYINISHYIKYISLTSLYRLPNLLEKSNSFQVNLCKSEATLQDPLLLSLFELT